MGRARKRQQGVQPNCPATEEIRVYRAGLYGRLSVLDNGKIDGDSLESQIDILEQYVSERPYLHYVQMYLDNGYTGTNFERPAWERMMADVQAGKIDCVIVKDLSRLGRNYLESGTFLEKDFPRMGLRFISINDGYDSAALNSSEELAAALKNIINDYYAKDISRKSCSALANKRQKGDYIGSYAPYGYRKDPKNKNHLIIDPETAPIVRQIFAWRAEGDGYGTILRKLNEQDIPSPGRYRFEHGIVTNNNKKGADLLWNRHVITDILKNIVYIGHLAQGKCRASLYQGIPAHITDSSEWDISYHTHEPILDDSLFYTVQAVNEQQAATYWNNYGKLDHLPKRVNPYREKLVCADCGARMKMYRNIYRGARKAIFTYICPNYEEHGKLACASKKSIRAEILDESVLTTIRAQIALFSDAHKVLALLSARQTKQSESNMRTTSAIQQIQHEIERKQGYLTSLYSDWKNGIFSFEEYTLAKERYRVDIEKLKQRLGEMKSCEQVKQDRLSRLKMWQAKAEQYRDVQQVLPELIDTFITEIRVLGDGGIAITFRFEDEYRQLLQEIENLRQEVA